MLTKILLSIGVVMFAFAMIATRVIFVKGGLFRGTCSSNNPFAKNKDGNCACGKDPSKDCKYKKGTTKVFN